MLKIVAADAERRLAGAGPVPRGDDPAFIREVIAAMPMGQITDLVMVNHGPVGIANREQLVGRRAPFDTKPKMIGSGRSAMRPKTSCGSKYRNTLSEMPNRTKKLRQNRAVGLTFRPSSSIDLTSGLPRSFRSQTARKFPHGRHTIIETDHVLSSVA